MLNKILSAAIILCLCVTMALAEAPEELTLDFEKAYEGIWYDIEDMGVAIYLPNTYKDISDKGPINTTAKINSQRLYEDKERALNIVIASINIDKRILEEFTDTQGETKYKQVIIKGRLFHINQSKYYNAALTENKDEYILLVMEKPDMQKQYLNDLEELQNIIASLKPIE